MKNFLVAVVVGVLFCLELQATPVLLMGTLVTVNNTTSNSPAISMTPYNPTTQTFSITHGALTATNAFVLNIQATLDQTNYVTIGSWYPTVTNAATETIYAGAYTVAPYIRASVTSTNSITIGGSYGQ